MLVTAVVKARADQLVAGRFTGQLTTVSDGTNQAFSDAGELVELLVANARALLPELAGEEGADTST